MCPDNLFGHLAATAVPGCEEVRDGAYRRTLRLPLGAGIVALRPKADHIACRLVLDDLRDRPAAESRCRWLLDLDADPEAVTDVLASDPARTRGARRAGRRVPRTVDEDEMALRVVLGQQVSTGQQRTHAARLVASYGTPIVDREGGLTHVFPAAEELVELDPSTLALPHARRRCVTALVRALADGELDLGAGGDWARARQQLAALPGIGPWTVEMIAMRALGDPDAFPNGDLGVRRAAQTLGLGTTPAALAARADGGGRGAPTPCSTSGRATTDHPINHWPINHWPPRA